MKTYRVALIGTGKIVGSHLQAIKSVGSRAEVCAAVDINAAAVERFCAENAIPKAYTDVETMLAEEKPDLVCIATPPATHKDICIQALEGGAWVYCEKPLCGSLAEFDAISAAEKRTGRYVSTVFQWRFGSAVKHLRRLMAQQALGRPLVAVCNTLWYRTQDYYNVSWRGTYASEFGGPTVGLGIHLMDLCFYLMGDWQEVKANIATLDRTIEIEDVSMAMVRFENGALGSIVNSALSPRQETYLRLDFQKATVEVTALYSASNANWRFSLPPDVADDQTSAAWAALSDDFSGAHDQQFRELIDSMDQQTAPAVNGAESRRILEFIASLYKSAVTGQPVLRGELTPDDPFYYSNNGQPK